MALEGNLRDFSLADMFRLIASSKRTGTLYLENGEAIGRVCMRVGRVFFASSNEAREPLGKRLVAANAITEQQLRQALGLQKIQRAEKGERRLGQILIDEGYVDAATLEAAIKEQITETLFELFRWEDGAIRFESGDGCDGEDIGISVSAEDVIMEASRRLEQWNKIFDRIPSLDTRYVMAELSGEKSLEIHLKPHEWTILCHLHPGRSIRELAELTGYSDFETARVLYGMQAAGLVDACGSSDAHAAELLEPLAVVG